MTLIYFATAPSFIKKKGLISTSTVPESTYPYFNIKGKNIIENQRSYLNVQKIEANIKVHPKFVRFFQ